MQFRQGTKRLLESLVHGLATNVPQDLITEHRGDDNWKMILWIPGASELGYIQTKMANWGAEGARDTHAETQRRLLSTTVEE